MHAKGQSARRGEEEGRERSSHVDFLWGSDQRIFSATKIGNRIPLHCLRVESASHCPIPIQEPIQSVTEYVNSYCTSCKIL